MLSVEGISFLEVVVAFPDVAEGNAREALLRVAKRLSGLGKAGADILDPEDERLVAEVRRGPGRAG